MKNIQDNHDPHYGVSRNNMMSENKKPENLLAGVQVLEIANEMGQYCGKMLADLGAEVIKIESPGGDSSRRIGPFYKDTPSAERSLRWWYHNTNKKSITLNLKTNDGLDIFKKLIKGADVLVETPEPGRMEGAGLGYGVLSELNPRLVLSCITGFGMNGPYCKYKASNLVGAGMGGMMSIVGDQDKPPIAPCGEAGYLTVCIFGAIATLLALYRQEAIGKGQLIDIPMQTCVASCLEYAFPYYAYLGTNLKRMGSRLQSFGPGKNTFCYPTKDGGYVYGVTSAPPLDWMEEEGMVDDLKEDERLWYDWMYRIEKEEHVNDVFSRFVKTHTKKEMYDQLLEKRSVWSTVRTIEEVANDPHLRERGFFTEVKHPDLGQDITYARPPAIIDGKVGRLRPSPKIGEHNEEIYSGRMGMEKEEIIALVSAGVI
ncbi:MAG: CoA transferase [Deltaproteobacteria bacterium]|nr:CoA transferase [Deltaproteobacteria bacterium]